MWNIYPLVRQNEHDPTILVTNDKGNPCRLSSDPSGLLVWLAAEGVNHIELQIEGCTAVFHVWPEHEVYEPSRSRYLEEILLKAEPHPLWPTFGDIHPATLRQAP